MSEKKQVHSNYILGLFLILLGVFILIIQSDYFHWDNFWPYILIISGTLFFLGFIVNRNNFGLLMPGSILLIIGVLFLYLNSGNWYRMEELWPTFILAPGIGFLFMFLFGPKGNALWIPCFILVTIALLFYARFWCILRYWPVALILIGLYIILSGLWGKDSKSSDNPVDFTGE